MRAAEAGGILPPGGNGDYSTAGVVTFFGAGGQGDNNGLADYHDVYRLHYQAMEQLHWSFGTGEKFSITNMPTKYFPDAQGLSGDLGGVSDTIHLQNGDPTHTALLRLARAVLLPPRQNVKCVANISQLPDGGQGATIGTTQGPRNMLSLRDNLNASDGMWKVVQFAFDGLFARDVQ